MMLQLRQKGGSYRLVEEAAVTGSVLRVPSKMMVSRAWVTEPKTP